MKVLALALAVAATATPFIAGAEDQGLVTDEQILLKQVMADKRSVYAANLKLSDTESRVFWPIYDEYEGQVKKLDDRFGITVVGGQDKLKGKIIRVGHMGYNDELDVIGALAALELVLSELGLEFEPGAGVAAAQRALLGQPSLAGSR